MPLYLKNNNSRIGLIISIIVALVTSLNLIPGSIEKKWILSLSEFLDDSKEEANEIKVEIIKYHTLLFELGNRHEALKMFQKPGFKLEKIDLINNLLNNKRFNSNPDKESLQEILNEIQKIQFPIDTCDYLLRVAYLFLSINELEKVNEVLETAEREVLEMEAKYGCNKQIYYLIHLFKMYTLMKNEMEAERILRQTSIQYIKCNREFRKIYRYSEDENMYVVFRSLADRFIELKDYDRAGEFIERLKISKGLDRCWADVDLMFELSEFYLKIQKSKKAVETLKHLFGFYLEEENFRSMKKSCKGRYRKLKKGSRMKRFMAALNRNLVKYDLFEEINPLFFVKELNKIGNGPLDEDIKALVNKALIELYIENNDFHKAYQLALFLDNSGFEENIRSEYILAIYDKVLSMDLAGRFKEWINEIKGTYCKIVFHYETAVYWLDQKQEKQARVSLKTAKLLVKKYNPRNIFRLHGIDLMKIGVLYWRLDDIKALDEIKELLKIKYSGNLLKKFCSEIQLWQVDIYLNKGEAISALQLVNKLELPLSKAIGLLYLSSYYLNEGSVKEGEIYLDMCRSNLKNLNSIDFDEFIDECYRVFVYKKLPDIKTYKHRFIETGYGPER